MAWLNGKKTLIGSLLLSLLGACCLLDQIVHNGMLVWFTQANYEAVGGIVAGFTGVSMRSSNAKIETKIDALASPKE